MTGKPARWPAAIGCASPAPNAEAAIVAMGAVMPEALAAWEELRDDIPGLGLLSVTSPDLLHRGWTAAQAARWGGERKPSHAEQLLSRLAPGAGLVTIADAAPASLSWLGGVFGQRVAPLGVDNFGQTGNLADLYAAYRLDGGGDHRSGGGNFAPKRTIKPVFTRAI